MTQCRHRAANKRIRGPRRSAWFAFLPRRRRRDAVVSLRWKITTDPDGLGVFTSHQLLPGTPSWIKSGGPADEHYATHWADILFVSRRPVREGVFYNATVRTVAQKVVDELLREAKQVVASQVSPEERAQYADRPLWHFTPSGRGTFLMTFEPSPVFASLGGMTERQAQARWLREQLPLLERRQATTRVEVEQGYAYGVGLQMVVDCTSLTQTTLADAVRAFWDGQERPQECLVDITPHLPGIYGLLKREILVREHVAARERGQKDGEIDWSWLDPDERRHAHNGSTAVKM